MNKKHIPLFICLTLLISFGFIPGLGAAPKEQAKKAEQSAKAVSPSRWDAVVQAARAEGSLIVYSTVNPATKLALTKAMKDRYGITVDFMIGRGEELIQRIATEYQAGLYLGDLVLAGVGSLSQNLRPTGTMAALDSALILPEVADPGRWLGKKLPFMGKEHDIIAFVSKTSSYVAANRDIAKSGAIKSFRDLLDPKWKGKLVMDDPTVTGAASEFCQLMLVLSGPEKGREFLQQLARQDLTVMRNKRLVVEWLARNKYPVAIGVDAQTYSEFRANGATIDYLKLSEGSASTSSGGNISMLKRAAHPNASLVFINWLLTREGQAIFQKAYGTPTARLDVDMTGIDPGFAAQEGERLISIMNEEWYANKASGEELVRQIFKPLQQ